MTEITKGQYEFAEQRIEELLPLVNDLWMIPNVWSLH